MRILCVCLLKFTLIFIIFFCFLNSFFYLLFLFIYLFILESYILPDPNSKTVNLFEIPLTKQIRIKIKFFVICTLKDDFFTLIPVRKLGSEGRLRQITAPPRADRV